MNYQELGLIESVNTIFKTEGFSGFYKGLLSNALRNSYSTGLKFCLLQPVYNIIHPIIQKQNYISENFAISSIIGTINIFTFTHLFDIYKINLMTNIQSKSLINSMTQIFHHSIKQSGFKISLQINLLQKIIKINIFLHYFQRFQKSYQSNNYMTCFTTTFIATFVQSLIILPIEITKLHIIRNPMNYRHIIDITFHMFAKNGLSGLYLGFIPYFISNMFQNSLKYAILSNYFEYDHNSTKIEN